jgi:hypothetical protein
MRKMISLLSVWALLLAMSTGVQAQERLPQEAATGQSNESGEEEVGGLVEVSGVNIPIAEVIDRDDRTLTVKFTVENQGEKFESNIRYGALLFAVDENETESVIDEVYTGDLFALAPGAQVEKELTYTVPASLRGDIAVGVVVSNIQGLTLSQTAGVERFTFEDESGTIFIDLASCSLGIEGDEQKYSLIQGVDIAPNENATIICPIVNGAEFDVPIVPEVSVYSRTFTTEPISQEKYAMEIVSASASRNLEIPIPKIESPQTYKVRVDLLHAETMELISNPVLGHVVGQGTSASVKNVQLDKASYAKGDVAMISAFVGGQASYFGTARDSLNEVIAEGESLAYTAKISLQSDGRECGSPVEHALGADADPYFTREIDVTTKCPNPTALVTIAEQGGADLDSAQISLTDDGSGNVILAAPGATVDGASASKRMNPIVLLVVIGSLLLAFIVLIMRKRSGLNTLLPVLVLGGMFLFSAATDAKTLTATQTWNESAVLNYNITSGVCDPKISGTLTINNCGNPNNTGQPDACGQVHVDWQQIVDRTVVGSNSSVVVPFSSNLPKNKTSVPVQVTYSSHCTYAAGATQRASSNESYSVGSCGSPSSCGYRGGTVSNEPTNSQKCTNGGYVRSNSFNGSRWTWECEGTNGVWDGGCYVNRAVPPTNGSCGSANGSTVSSHPSGSSACSNGNFSDTSDSSSQYRWNCNGSNGGSNASCSANRPPAPIPGSCGSVNGTTQSSFPTSNLCNAGGAGSKSTTSTRYSWSCSGQNGGASASCFVNRPAAVSGSCGSANGTSTSSQPNSNLCSSGGASGVAAGSTTWSWTCYGSNGGGNASCSAPRTATAQNGSCGSAAGVTTSTAPTTNRCNTGNASNVTTSASAYWWQCTGVNGGSTQDCSAPRTTTTTPTNGSCGSGAGSCNAGSSQNMNTSGSTTTWQCAGSNGGSTASCTHTGGGGGSCGGLGTANGGTYPSQPSDSAMCGSGASSALNGCTWNAGSWTSSNPCGATYAQTDCDGGVCSTITMGGNGGGTNPGGTTMHVVNVNSTSSGWTWDCLNSSTGKLNGQCSANKATATNGSCATAPGSCSAGTAQNMSTSGSTTTWQCAGSNGGTTASCNATSTSGVNGVCGASNGATVTGAPTTGLCSTGGASAVAGSGPWTWTCAGSGGGVAASCSTSTTVPVTAPSCGTANGTDFLIGEPTGNQLCTSGTPSNITTVSDSTDPSKKYQKWTCTGGANVENCQAVSDCGDGGLSCGNKCVYVSLSGQSVINHDRSGGVVTTQQTVTGTDGAAACIESCDLYNSEGVLEQSGIPLGTVVGDIDIVHQPGNAGEEGVRLVCRRKPTGDNCDTDTTNDPDCDDIEKSKTISCVCTARRCSASGQCVASPIFGASSGSDVSCSSECSTDADCGGSGITEGSL